MNTIVGSSNKPGNELKAILVPLIRAAGNEVFDVGDFDDGETGAVAAALAVCARVANGGGARGIVFCGSGVLEGIVCNKVPGIRAAIGHDVHCAHQCVEHSDANVLILGATVVGPWLAEDLIRAFLDAQFMSEREDFKARLVQLDEMERAWS